MKALKRVREEYAAHVERSLLRLPRTVPAAPLPVAGQCLFELFVWRLDAFYEAAADNGIVVRWQKDWGGAITDEAWRWVSAGLLHKRCGTFKDDFVTLPPPLLLGFVADQLALQASSHGSGAGHRDGHEGVQRREQPPSLVDRATMQRVLARVALLSREERNPRAVWDVVKECCGWTDQNRPSSLWGRW